MSFFRPGQLFNGARSTAASSTGRSGQSAPRRDPTSQATTKPESLRVAEIREEQKRGSFTNLFVGSETNPRSLSALHKAYIQPGGDESLRPVLRGNLAGGLGAAHNLWHCFLEAAKDATELLDSSLATGHYWLPRTQAEHTLATAVSNASFKALFAKVEASALNEYLTGTTEDAWGF